MHRQPLRTRPADWLGSEGPHTRGSFSLPGRLVGGRAGGPFTGQPGWLCHVISRNGEGHQIVAFPRHAAAAVFE